MGDWTSIEDIKTVLGTVGLLIWVKRVSVIASLREQLDACGQRGGFALVSPFMRKPCVLLERLTYE